MTELTNTQRLVQIMEDLNLRVKNNQPISPAEWIEESLKLESMSGDLDNFLAEQEAKMLDKEIELLESEETASKAKVLKTKEIDYTLYLKMKALRKRVEGFIMLTKVRARIKEF